VAGSRIGAGVLMVVFVFGAAKWQKKKGGRGEYG